MDFQSEKSFGKLRLRAFQPYHQTLCIFKHVGDVGDRTSTPKGCNAIYVGDVGDCNNLHMQILPPLQSGKPSSVHGNWVLPH